MDEVKWSWMLARSSYTHGLQHYMPCPECWSPTEAMSLWLRYTLLCWLVSRVVNLLILVAAARCPGGRFTILEMTERQSRKVEIIIAAFQGHPSAVFAFIHYLLWGLRILWGFCRVRSFARDWCLNVDSFIAFCWSIRLHSSCCWAEQFRLRCCKTTCGTAPLTHIQWSPLSFSICAFWHQILLRRWQIAIWLR